MTPACDGTPTIIFVLAPSCIHQIVRRRNSTKDQCGTYNSKLYLQAPKEKACFNKRLYDSPFELMDQDLSQIVVKNPLGDDERKRKK